MMNDPPMHLHPNVRRIWQIIRTLGWRCIAEHHHQSSAVRRLRTADEEFEEARLNHAPI